MKFRSILQQAGPARGYPALFTAVCDRIVLPVPVLDGIGGLILWSEALRNDVRYPFRF